MGLLSQIEMNCLIMETGGRKESLAASEIRFVSISAKLGICTVVGLNGTLVEAKIHSFKCPKCTTVRWEMGG